MSGLWFSKGARVHLHCSNKQHILSTEAFRADEYVFEIYVSFSLATCL